ncbi:MAG: peptide ABC transporter substrate-binding protein [Aliidongia sp.]
MRSISPFATGLAVALLLAPAARAEQVLHRPIPSEPESLDPQKTTGAIELSIDRDLFTGLIVLDPHGQPAPGVAESWDESPDHKIWTFHLRKTGKWSNGDPVTAEDFVYGFRRLVDPKTAAADYTDLAEVANAEAIATGKEKDLTKLGVEAVDPYTLRVTLVRPRTILPFILTDEMLSPMPHAAIEKWGNDWTKPEHMVSNGPYMMKDWVPQSHVTLVKNPGFYDAASVKIDRVDFVLCETAETEYKQFEAGELDWTRLTRTHLAAAKRDEADRFISGDIYGSYFVFFNMAKGKFAGDERLREAFSLAIDRDVLVNKIEPLGEKAAYAVTPPWFADYDRPEPPAAMTDQAQRLARAKQLMADAGYGPEHPLEVTAIYTTDEDNRLVLLAMQQMLKPIGFELKLDNMEWQVMLSRQRQRDFDLGMESGLATYTDPETGMDNYRSDANDYSWGGYANPKFDALFHEAASAPDMATHRKLLSQAERLMLADYPIAPLWYYHRNRLTNPKLEGWDATIIYPQTRYLSFKG